MVKAQAETVHPHFIAGDVLDLVLQGVGGGPVATSQPQSGSRKVGRQVDDSRHLLAGGYTVLHRAHDDLVRGAAPAGNTISLV
jgi:hypothetical protein